MDPLADLPYWLQDFKDNLQEQNCMHPHTVLRNQIRNFLRKWQQNQGSTVFILTSQKTEIATYA